MEYDKINNGVCFRESDHVYFEEKNPDCKYISVTTLIHGFSQPFDAEFNSAMKALEQLLPPDVWAVEKKSLRARKKFDKSILNLYDIPETEFNKVQQSILDAWEENKNKACERGTAMHLEIENSFYNKGTNIDLQKFGVGGKFTCIKDYSDLDLPYGVYPEYLIYFKSKDGLLRLAGQIDLIIKSGNEITIADHKTNRKIDLKSFYDSSTKSSQKMQYPLNNLDDCNFNIYTLQLSTYAWMLQKINPDFVIKDLIINHYDHNGKNTLYHCEYRKHDVERMLAYYKKQIIKNIQRERRTPISYD